MKSFLLNLVIFLVPLIIIVSGLEIYSRMNNTFYAKTKLIQETADSVEVMILGSSQNWRAINPDFLSISCAPLAHGGSAFNIDYLLFKKHYNQFPRLKVVILETSYHTFDETRTRTWNKNHLFFIYYGINNYNGSIPKSDYFLVTANPKDYITRLWTASVFPEFGEYNKYGFITSEIQTIESGHYDPSFLKKRHQGENQENFLANNHLLREIVKTCTQKHIEVVFLSPPKYYTYNDLNSEHKLAKRESIFNEYRNQKYVHIWNYEKFLEKKGDLFSNEDHLNVKGAEIFSKEINDRISHLIQTRQLNYKSLN